MSLVKAKKTGNGNGNWFPSALPDFFLTDVFGRPIMPDSNWAFPGIAASTAIPSVNITENSKDFKIEMAAPGLEKEDFKIETSNGLLSISCEKKHETKEAHENYRRREFSYESFCRSFSLPENSLPEKIEAKYDNGILHLTLPKKEATGSNQKKEIKVA